MLHAASTRSCARTPSWRSRSARSDDAIDKLHAQLFRELLAIMSEDPATISRAMRLLFVSKYLERIGDHATNIAEMVIFMVKGQSIRHMDTVPREL